MRIAAILFVLMITVACGGAPTAPTEVAASVPASLVEGSASTAGPRDIRPVAGQVTNVLSGAGVGGAIIHVAEVGDVASGADGQFQLESEAADGRYRISTSGAGFVERQTTLVFPGDPALIPIIPTSFNLQAFDQMTRQFGGGGALKRWLQAPALVVEMSLLDRAASIDPSGIPKETVIASEQQQTEAGVAELVAHLTRALPLLTGGRFTDFSSVGRETAAPGSAVTLDRDGTITVVRYPGTGGRCAGYGGFAYFDTFDIASGRVFLEVCSDTSLAPGLAAHELGHALGYGHVTGVSSVMTATVIGDVTEFDRQAGTIAYQRPPGNQAPDTDPEAFTVNQAQRMPAGLRRITVGPVP